MEKALQLTLCAVTLSAALTIEAQVQTHETRGLMKESLKIQGSFSKKQRAI